VLTNEDIAKYNHNIINQSSSIIILFNSNPTDWNMKREKQTSLDAAPPRIRSNKIKKTRSKIEKPERRGKLILSRSRK
jgi:hypothetical protein